VCLSEVKVGRREGRRLSNRGEEIQNAALGLLNRGEDGLLLLTGGVFADRLDADHGIALGCRSTKQTHWVRNWSSRV